VSVSSVYFSVIPNSLSTRQTGQPSCNSIVSDTAWYSDTT